ncbi:MAG: MFS transporter [Chloroflexi bacterium]|nr:MFS transporter [Chloroflexota bacterium]
MKKLPRNVWVVTVTSFLTDVSSEMVVHVLPLYLANVLGARTDVIGLIEGAGETAASLLKLLSGWLSDRLGSREWLTVAGYGLSTLAKPFLLIAGTWEAVLAVRLSDRVGKGIRTAPRDALIADSIDGAQRGLAFGLHRAGDTAGAALGLLVALIVVASVQHFGMLLTADTFKTLVAISIVPAALAVVALAFGVREVPLKTGARLPRLSLAEFDNRFKAFLLIVVLFTLGNSSDAFLVLRAQERGVSVTGIMAMVLLFNIVYAILAGPAGKLSDRIGRRRLIVAGWLVYGLIYLGFALAGAGWQLFALYALYGIYYGVTEGVGNALIADLVAPEQRGTAYGLYNAAVAVMALPASFIAGVLWQGIGSFAGFGPRAPFLFGAALAVVSALLLAGLVLPKASGRTTSPQ